MNVFKHVKTFFDTYLKHERGLAENTIKSYAEAIRQLLRFAAGKRDCEVNELDLATFDDELVLSFLDAVEADNSIATRNQRLSPIRSFFKYLARREPRMLEAADRITGIKNKRSPEPEPHTQLTETQLHALTKAAGEQDNPLQAARDLALVTLLHNTGARASEIVDLDTDRVDTGHQPTVTLTGKGDRTRHTPLWPETVEAINAYLRIRTVRGIDHHALFLNPQRRRLTRFGLRKVVLRLTARARQSDPSLEELTVTTHTFRHTTAFHILRATRDLAVAQNWLGHKDINTTSAYVNIDPETKRRAFETFRAPNAAVPASRWKEPATLKLLTGLARNA